MGTSQARGLAAERRAARYLTERGLALLATNYRCRFGEIDLIMRDREQLVFVEVRLRRHGGFGGALESVDHRKQRRIGLAARHYLQRERLDAPCRFDVVGIDGEDRIEWLRDAFTLA